MSPCGRGSLAFSWLSERRCGRIETSPKPGVAGSIPATVPDFLSIEWHSVDVSWWADTVHYDGAIMENGFIKVPNRAGLGVELNDEVCRKYLAKGSTYFE